MHRLPLVLLLLAMTCSAQERGAAPTISADPQAVTVTVNLNGTPTTGICPYTINMSWSATNASACTKSGAWTGNAGASGSEMVQVNSNQATFTLTCSSSNDSRTLTWVNPTQNVDGSAASLSGNKVFHSNSNSTVDSAQPIVLTPAKTTYVLGGLPAGVRYVGIKATSANGIDSVMSQLATTTIVLPTGADSVQATCTPPPEPKPPTAVTIAGTVWEQIQTGSGTKVGRDVGNIPLDVQCLGDEAIVVQGDPTIQRIEYWAVPRDLTRLYRKPKSVVLLGRCALKSFPS